MRGSVERNCAPMDKTWREGVAKQGEWACFREVYVIQAKRRKSDGRAVSDVRASGRLGMARGEAARELVSDEAGSPRHDTETERRHCWWQC